MNKNNMYCSNKFNQVGSNDINYSAKKISIFKALQLNTVGHTDGYIRGNMG